MSFAGHTFRCPFVNGFPHFMHVLLRSILRLGSFLIWLWLLKDLKVVPLVDDRAIFVNLWWLKYPFLSIKAWLSASVGLILTESSFLWVSVFLMLQMKTSLIHSASSFPLYYTYSPSPLGLPRIAHMIPGPSVYGWVIYISRTLCWAVCWKLHQVGFRTLWRRLLQSWPSGSFARNSFSSAP